MKWIDPSIQLIAVAATAVNAEGAFGRWAFLEITDPWDAQNTIRRSLSGRG